MRHGLIITAIGRDRPGIVDRISGAVFRAGCNLEDSRMAILGGEFALMALASGPPERLRELESGVGAIGAELALTTVFKPTRIDESRADLKDRIPYRVTAVALDHPGIVHRLSHLLAEHDVNVADLETRLTHAPISGAPMFSLALLAQVPADLPVSRLRDALGALADAENIDIDLHAVP